MLKNELYDKVCVWYDEPLLYENFCVSGKFPETA